MSALIVLEDMFRQYEAKFGKQPTEVKLDSGMYFAVRNELREAAKIPDDYEIDYVKYKGVLLQKRELPKEAP